MSRLARSSSTLSLGSGASYRLLGIDWRISPDHRSDTLVFVAYWLLGGPIVLASFDDDLALWGVLLEFVYMVFAYTASAWLIFNLIFATFVPKRQYLGSLAFVLLVVVCCAIGSQCLNEFIYTPRYPFWPATLKWQLPNDAQNILTIVAILAAKKYFRERQRTTELESERRQAELNRLRAQVDPHFLFNSLNILDILIEDDPAEARHFVHRLSNLYRYLIRHRDEDLVPVNDELAYARDYRYLVERRFGKAFRFRENLDTADLAGYYLPPGSLQTILENVFKHNLATELRPVMVTLGRDGEALLVSNDYSPKPGRLATDAASAKTEEASLGGEQSGLDNLKRRFALLSDGEVYARREGDRWSVRLPLVRMSVFNVQAAPVPTRPA